METIVKILRNRYFMVLTNFLIYGLLFGAITHNLLLGFIIGLFMSALNLIVKSALGKVKVG